MISIHTETIHMFSTVVDTKHSAKKVPHSAYFSRYDCDFDMTSQNVNICLEHTRLLRRPASRTIMTDMLFLLYVYVDVELS
jgi:hypothetical protein